MPLPQLEVFETATPDTAPEVVVTDRASVEEARLAAWEQGYRAGWDDAVSAEAGEKEKIAADLARNLQALAFTWQEARAHILSAVEPLLTGMVERILPELARESLAPMVLEQLMPLAAEAADQPATLVLNPAVRTRVETMLTAATGLPLVIDEEPSLGEGQVYIRLGPREVKVDLSRATTAITAAVHNFFTLSQENPDG